MTKAERIKRLLSKSENDLFAGIADVEAVPGGLIISGGAVQDLFTARAGRS